MASTTNFRGLQVFQPAPPGPGGADISNNFIDLVTWNPQSQWAGTAVPTAGDDSTQNYFPGSFWLNTGSGTGTSQIYVCSDNTASAAIWLPVMRIQSNGAITVPDAPGSVAGNARGKYAVDLQAARNAATQVAAAGYSIVIGNSCTANGSYGCMAIGYSCTSSGRFGCTSIGYDCTSSGKYGCTSSGYGCTSSGKYGCTSIGYGCTSSGKYGCTSIGIDCVSSGNYGCTAIGFNSIASGAYSTAFGANSTANHDGELAFSPRGETWQSSVFSFGAGTTDATQTELTTDGHAPNANALGASPNTNRFLLEAKTYGCIVTICARQSGGSNVAMYRREFYVSQDTNGNVTLSAVDTIGTDKVTAGFSGLAVAIATDTTAKALKILVTGLASTTINWIATVDAAIINVN